MLEIFIVYGLIGVKVKNFLIHLVQKYVKGTLMQI